MYKCDKCGKPIEVIAIYYKTFPKFKRYCYDCYRAEEEKRKEEKRKEATLKRARNKVAVTGDRYLSSTIRNLYRQGIKPKDIGYAFDLTEEEVIKRLND